MNSNKCAFTLIELLVIVLIIGILTAVAVPQYQKAVAKTQLLEVVSQIETIHKSVVLYQLANGKRPAANESLDAWDREEGNKAYIGKRMWSRNASYISTTLESAVGTISCIMYIKHSSWTDATYCNSTDRRAIAFLRGLGWKTVSSIPNTYSVPVSYSK